jgi:uncharacterized protein
MKEAIQRWNSWWESPDNINKIFGTERTKLSEILEELKIPHIKDIIGVRRCGKTILMYQVISKLIDRGIAPKKILYLNFDDPEFFDLKDTIKTSLQINPDISYIFLDEIQNVKEWEKTVRVYYDQKKFKQIIISGSSASLISRDVGRTLTGRHVTKNMVPFSFSEYLDTKEIKKPSSIQSRDKVIYNLEMFLKNGGFPETVNADEMISKTILVDLYNDILSRDIASRFDADLDIVKKLGYYLMTNISSPFSYNSLSKALDIHHETVKKYVSYFEEVFLLYVVPYFSWKIKTRVKKDMKCYSVDTGLRNAVSFKFSDDIGKLAENAVLVELKRRGSEVYFWKEKREVDFIVRNKNKLIAINVTYTDKIADREKESLLLFKEKHKDAELVIITKELEEEDDSRIRYIPLWKWLIEDSEIY